MQAQAPLPEQLQEIRQAIADAARASGRTPDAVKLVAVSKQQGAERIQALFGAGQARFGESYLQEAVPKLAALAGLGIEWHYVGALQSNKAKHLPGRFAWVHSLASLSAARALAARAATTPVSVLIEVNVSADPRKQGLAIDAVPSFLESLLESGFQGLHYRGLMAIGPETGDEAALRHAFAALRTLAHDLRRGFGLAAFDELSMGMSADFIPAIHEGATFVRVGQALFGARHGTRAAT